MGFCNFRFLSLLLFCTKVIGTPFCQNLPSLQNNCSKRLQTRRVPSKISVFDMCEESMEIMQEVRLGPFSA